MGDSRRRVFVTGATGTWGAATMRELAQMPDQVRVVALVHPQEARRRLTRELAQMANVRVVFGDVTDLSVVGPAVACADVVLHVAGVVPPGADDHPELTRRVNIGGVQAIIAAVKQRPDPQHCAVVMVGSVAQTGDRNPPYHWGRVGDPVRVAQDDVYGLTKVIGERLLVESGLPRWVWLRQTGIFSATPMQLRDPIFTHVPLGGVMEWVSVEDSARLAAALTRSDLPEQLWNRVFNVGGGPGWRFTNWEFLAATNAALGIGDVRQVYERNWFATRNFHGHWFTDSEALQELVPYRRDNFPDALARAASQISGVRVARHIPPSWLKRFVFEPLSRQPRGIPAWVEAHDDAKVRAAFGSWAEYEQLGDWSTFVPPQPSATPVEVEHGYDEDLSPGQWTRAVLQGAAHFRGGLLLTPRVYRGQPTRQLQWRCAEGHDFVASPVLVLQAGHWCPTCVACPQDYAIQAKSNPFLAQVQP